MAKAAVWSIVALVAYSWLAAYGWHLLPDPQGQWWRVPLIYTTICGAVGIYAAVWWFFSKDYSNG